MALGACGQGSSAHGAGPSPVPTPGPAARAPSPSAAPTSGSRDGGVREAPPTPLARPASVEEALSSVERSYLRYIPPASPRPAPVVVALHGFADRGEDFAAPLVERARAEGWVLVAPTFRYGDWRSPAQLAHEGPTLVRYLHELIGRLPAEVGSPVQPKVLLYGFSRGAQLAHRFAYVHPEQVLGVAALAAGSYTLPLERVAGAEGSVELAYPFGVSDLEAHYGRRLDRERLRQVSFLIGVGALDTDPSILPRQWDALLGPDRVARARVFARILREQGVPVELRVFPGVGHETSGPPRAAALDFLSGLAQRAGAEPAPNAETPEPAHASPSGPL